MPERKDDEIMAEYLLKGGKMLEKACPTCGCPLFEYKKKTFCVVCAEKKPVLETAPLPPAITPAKNASPVAEAASPVHPSLTPEAEMLSRELSGTIAVLCQRIKNDGDPDNCLAFMDAVKIGTEALLNLRQL
ncbi:Sjogren's syndrome/scleroderma autoantigen 1 family protein [Methanoregula sp.]|jgi:UPF0148 protein|uniref:Sjogren's syndrome/scleroderma autoantigen 1 family protein n=1 Tax=Methanoregula sp. TaxID=2052170 RepID=UPI003C1D3980